MDYIKAEYLVKNYFQPRLVMLVSKSAFYVNLWIRNVIKYQDLLAERKDLTGRMEGISNLWRSYIRILGRKREVLAELERKFEALVQIYLELKGQEKEATMD